MGNLIGNNLHVAGTHTLHSRCKDEIEIHWTYVKKEQKKNVSQLGPWRKGESLLWGFIIL